MKYLNERITQQINLGSIQPKGMYKYEVQVSNLSEQSGWTTIFVGNYYNNSLSYYTFDITDLCRSRKNNVHTSYNKTFDTDVPLVEQYRIIVTKSDNTTVTGAAITVAHIYPYTNVQNTTLFMYPSSAFFDITSSTRTDVSLLLQGNNQHRTGTNNLYLCPRYPLVNNAQDLDEGYTMTFGATIEIGSSQGSTALFVIEAGDDYTDSTNYYGYYELKNLRQNDYSHTFFDTYGNFFPTPYEPLLMNIDYWVYMTWKDTNNVSQYRRIAIIEACKSRYYLLWQDRFGSYQSQPFNGKIEYSEDITNSEYVSYTGNRNKYNVQVQSKWKLNSGWLKEDLFPFYESIYVSPILRLYDTETNTEYDVIMKDTPYIEKKYHNEKSLLSINLTLEATETQNIIY